MRALVATCLCLAALVNCARAAELHGATDAFAAAGVAVAWAVLRGASEESTLVVLRVAADARRYARLEVLGVDPFSRDAKVRHEQAALGAALEVRLPRAGFADHPRTELRFSGVETLVIYYLGIPDTTPEFATEAALNEHLRARLERLQAEGAKR